MYKAVMRCRQDLIAGYRPAGSSGIDALLVGYYDDTGLRFAGKVRAGFVPHLRREVFKALKPHHVDACPFVDLRQSKLSRWGGGGVTAEGRLRHAAFLGLRSDKSAREGAAGSERKQLMSFWIRPGANVHALRRISSCPTVGMLYVLHPGELCAWRGT
jgi:ATP dependent DNA ligase C terminal region